jgi:hypothetical protein
MEWLALLSIGISFLLAVVFNLRFYWPDTHSSAFALEHYLEGISFSVVILFLISWRQNRSRAIIELLSLGRQIIAFLLVVFLHFNFKMWAMLINPNRWDIHYAAFDQTFNVILAVFAFINLGFTQLKAALPDAYHDIFVALFLLTFLSFGLAQKKHALEQALLAVALVLVLGGMAYIAAPAYGPFIDMPDTGSNADRIQQDMLHFMQDFLRSNGTRYQGGNFIMPLAAIPSLHVAHAWVLLYYAWKHLRVLGWLYLPCFLFLSSEAVASRWHYLIDLVFGLIIAWISIRLANAWLASYVSSGSALSEGLDSFRSRK